MAEWQWKRWDVLQRLMRGALTMGEAAQVLQLSVRHVRRLRRRAERDGRQAVVHGNRGRRPVHTLDPAVRERILTLRRTTYRESIVNSKRRFGAGLTYNALSDVPRPLSTPFVCL